MWGAASDAKTEAKVVRIQLNRPFSLGGGSCVIASLPSLSAIADGPVGLESPAVLLEDGIPLGPAHAVHNEIRAQGHGRFSHWLRDIFFSSSDGTDPNENGRSYEVEIDDRVCERSARNATAYDEAAQCVICLSAYMSNVPNVLTSFAGAEILEIGPRHIGVATVLSALGARVTLVEPHPCSWDDSFHPAYLRRCYELAESSLGLNLPRCRLEESIAGRTVTDRNVRVLNCTAETMGNQIDRTLFDYVFSNSVFEHFLDSAAAVSAIARASKRGCVHQHGVDYRDHRYFSTPLEFLLEDDEEYDSGMITGGVDRGNRTRASEVEALIMDCNLFIEKKVVRMWATSECVSTFREDVKNRGRSRRFRECSLADLYTLSADYVLVKF